jgi:predicted nucleotidyltransferase
MQPFIEEKREEIAELCRKHHVIRLSIFGSAVRDDFNPATSDVDVLVAFTPALESGYAKNFYSLEDNLVNLFQRRVDLITEGVIKNPYRLRSIEQDKVLVYAT